MEYCSTVWSPSRLKDIDSIEQIQRYFTRRIHGLAEYNYNERLFILNLESLEERRLKFDMCMYFKILTNEVDTNVGDFFVIRDKPYNMRGHNMTLERRACKSNLFRNSFANRNINCWNCLPSHVVNAGSLSHFKRNLNKTDLNTFIKGRALK